MANEIRLRSNNISGQITDNPLAIGATTINSPGFVDLPTVGATNHLMLILDPTEVGGTAEIVKVTAHTAAASSVTVLRGQDGSAARSHVVNTTWFHGPVVSDYNYTDVLALSSNRPAGPYKGQMIFETDTNKLQVFGGVDWAPRDAGGQLGSSTTTSIQTGITTETDIAGLSITVIVGTGRRVKLSVQGTIDSSVANDTGITRIKESATELLTIKTQIPVNSGTDQNSLSGFTLLSPSAGTHTYKVTLARSSGTGTFRWVGTSTAPTFLLAEDIGAA